MPGHAAPQMVRQRATELRALGEIKRRKFIQSQAGKAVQVLTLETAGQGWREAISGNYQRVRVAGTWARNIWLMAWPTADGSPARAEISGKAVN
jgi:hypothetical protein